MTLYPVFLGEPGIDQCELNALRLRLEQAAGLFGQGQAVLAAVRGEAEMAHRVRRRNDIALCPQCIDRLLQIGSDLFDVDPGNRARAGRIRQHLRPARIALRQEAKRFAEVAFPLARMETEGPFSGERAEPDRGVGERLDLFDVACSGRELESSPVMVGQEFRVVADSLAGDPLDPLRRHHVLVSPRRARDLPVRHVAHQDVPERVLHVVFDGGGASAPNELLSDQFVQASQHRLLRGVSHRGERAGPEDLADHCCVVNEPLPVGRERVEPGGDHGVQAVGNRDLGVGRDFQPVASPGQEAAVIEHPYELLGVQGIPAGALEQCRLELLRKRRREQL